MLKYLALILVLLVLPGCFGPSKTQEVHFQLKNGLYVILRHVESAEKVAIVTLFDFGEDHDPAGKSGMGHLIEHLYVTAAAGNTPARNIQAYMAAYPAGWNAQTGKNYTVIAAVFPPGRLNAELADAASRLSNLKPQQSDLQREIPRMQVELLNMYEKMPFLMAQNLAVNLRVPHRPNSRKGGVIEQINSITLEQINQRLQAYYKPANATLIIAGNIEIDKIRQAVIKVFSEIDAGTKIKSPVYQADAPESLVTFWPSKPLSPQGYVALAINAPKPTDKRFPAFLILAARLQMKAKELNPPKNTFPVAYAVLDRPEALLVHFPVAPGGNAEAVASKLAKFVADKTTEPLSSKDKIIARQMFGFALGLQPYPDKVLAQNVYGVALSAGMRKQLKIDHNQLVQKLNAVTQAELTQTAREFFSPDKYSTALVNPMKK
jgi:predicted Zn-dependent peptidase